MSEIQFRELPVKEGAEILRRDGPFFNGDGCYWIGAEGCTAEEALAEIRALEPDCPDDAEVKKVHGRVGVIQHDAPWLELDPHGPFELWQVDAS